MNIFSFKNSTVESLDLSSNITTKIINNDTQINSININNHLCILSGGFTSEINITNNCLLNLDYNFNLINNSINLINNTTEKKAITIVGTLDNPTSDLKIKSDNNIILKLSIFQKAFSINSINVFVNSIKNNADFFKIHFIENEPQKKLPVNLQITNTKNILIDTDLKTFDTGTSADINLVVTEKSNILNFKNIIDATFNSVTASERIIEIIETLFPITVPIKSLLFKVNFKNGMGTVFIPSNRIIANAPNMNVILNSKEIYN